MLRDHIGKLCDRREVHHLILLDQHLIIFKKLLFLLIRKLDSKIRAALIQ